VVVVVGDVRVVVDVGVAVLVSVGAVFRVVVCDG
jgi:hypothetical protein